MWRILIGFSFILGTLCFATPGVTADTNTVPPLRIAHTADYAPYEWVNAAGERSGFLIAVYEAWSQANGHPISWHTMSWSACLAALEAGEVDVITGASFTPERAHTFAFGRELARAESRIFTHRSLPTAERWEDLEGLLVGVVEGDQSAHTIATAAPHAEIRHYPDYIQLVAAAIAGEVRVMAGTSGVIYHLLTRNDAVAKFALSSQPLNSEPLSPMVRKDREDLLLLLESGFAVMPAEQLTALARQWVPHSLEPLDGRPWQRWLLISGMVATIAGLIALGALLWTLSLRRRVAQQMAIADDLRHDLVSFLQTVEDAAIIGTDEQGIVRYLNRGAEHLLGIQAAKTIGKTSPLRWWLRSEREDIALDKGSDASDFHLLSDGANEHGGHLVDLTWQDDNGHEIPVRLHVTVVRNEEGLVRGYLLIARNREQEQEVERRREHGERLEALGKLAGGVAHDFNNLLTGMMGFADLIVHDPQATAEIREAATTIGSVGKRAATLSRQLLAFSRRDIGPRQRLDLRQLCLDTTALLARTLPKTIVIITEIDDAPHWICGEHAALESALVNLVVNAAQAQQDEGQVTISIEDSGQHWRWRVSDHGPGIPASIRDKIFEPFFTTKEIGKGTGLGLAAVWGTITKHGGSIRVECPPNGGTTFTILLPKDPSANADEGG